MNDKLKLKGAYMHKGRSWHQDQSALVIQKAVEAHLIRGESVSDFIYGHIDPFDFCARTNVKRGSRLAFGADDEIQQRITRYYIARGNDGGQLVKIMPPTASQKLKNPAAPDRRIAIEKGWNVIVCNDMKNFDWLSVNHEYYIEKAMELINPVLRRIE